MESTGRGAGRELHAIPRRFSSRLHPAPSSALLLTTTAAVTTVTSKCFSAI
jgi:hypothetical protein